MWRVLKKQELVHFILIIIDLNLQCCIYACERTIIYTFIVCRVSARVDTRCHILPGLPGMSLFFDLCFWILFHVGQQSASAKRSAAHHPSALLTRTIPNPKKIKKSAPIRNSPAIGAKPRSGSAFKKIKTDPKKLHPQNQPKNVNGV